MKTIQKIAAIIALFLLPAFTFSQDLEVQKQPEQQPEVQLQTDQALPQEDLDLSKIKDKPTGHEIYLGYGYPNSLGTVFINGMTDVFSIIFSGGTQSIETKGPGVVQLGYNYIFENGFSLGGFATYEPYTLNYINTSDSSLSRHSKQAVFTIQATARYQYGWKYARLYHGVSAGLSILADFEEDTAGAAFTLNIIPIGVKVGLEKGINFYADVGLWSSPLINAGLSYRF